MPKKQRAYTVSLQYTAIEHKINMALQGATHCCNLKRTALDEKMLCTTTTKPPSRSRFYVDFKNNIFKDQKIGTQIPSADVLRFVR